MAANTCWYLFVGLLLAGCAATAKDEPTTAGPDPSPSQTTAPAPVTPVVKIDGNPNRIHQLKDLEKLDLSVKGHPVHAWIMDDDAKQEEGMMFLTDKEIKPDEGMLFVFDAVQRQADKRGFWMHNTLIPLDIVYMSPAGKVVNVAHGKVQDDTTLPAQGDFQYVLEVKAGTAARLGLKAGDTVPIPKLTKG